METLKCNIDIMTHVVMHIIVKKYLNAALQLGVFIRRYRGIEELNRFGFYTSSNYLNE